MPQGNAPTPEEENAPNLSHSSHEKGTNPVAGALDVTLSVPQRVEIRMVEAQVLADYELWFFLSSLLFGAVVGFGVGFLQSVPRHKIEPNADWSLLWITLVWLILFSVTLVTALRKRSALRSKTKSITLRAVVDQPESD